MSAPDWEAPRELYFYDEWLQQNAKGRLLCGNNRYVLCTHTDERVRALVEAARIVWGRLNALRSVNMINQAWKNDIDDLDAALRALEQGEG